MKWLLISTLLCMSCEPEFKDSCDQRRREYVMQCAEMLSAKQCYENWEALKHEFSYCRPAEKP